LRAAWSWTIAALDYITGQGASVDVVSMSLGSGPESCYAPACNAISGAKNAGVAVAVAAGNSNDEYVKISVLHGFMVWSL